MKDPFPFGYHHKIQEIIKSKRKNKDKRINFPKDLLNSVRYRQMLRNKVGFPQLTSLNRKVDLTLSKE